MGDLHDPSLDVLRSAANPLERFATIFEDFRPQLERAVSFRMDRRVRARVGSNDVVQEAYLECARRLESYLEEPKASVFLWCRFLVLQRLLQLHRQHLGRDVRDAGRELSINQGVQAGASSLILADHLIDSHTSPTRAAARAEAKVRVTAALEEMGEIDREIVMLRNFEQMNSAQAAEVLGIAHDAARKRYLRALKKLKTIFEKIEGL